jgi:pyruvate/2-oxoglutarate dehydrogenase complex dihydrolipoamide dehydrogenase (E3) component
VGHHYDLVVIGAGPAGLSAAGFAARLGARVALVERARVGGDCTWTGCVPSKALLHAAGLAWRARQLGAIGLPPVEGRADLAAVLRQVRAAIGRVYAHETPEALARQGIEILHGRAAFVGPRSVEVDGRRLEARRFIVCPGAAPAIPPLVGLAETPYLTYLDVFDLATLPERLLVLGGGPVGVELAQAFRRLGSAVTVLEQDRRLLPQADPDASTALAERFAGEGIDVRLGARVERVERARDGVAVHVAGARVEGDALLVAVGRRPALDGLGLERAGVAYSPRGIVVDERLRTTNHHVYACGDAIGGPQFTHSAAWQGYVAARNALLPGAIQGQSDVVPWVVFTDPEIAHVGLTALDARARWTAVQMTRWPLERVDRAQTAGERTGFVKLVSRSDGRLVGATVVSPSAGELVNELALAIRRKLTLRDLATTIHAYPTYGFAIQQASAEAVLTGLARGWRARLLRMVARRVR